MPLNIKQITDWLNEAQQDFNRPMGQPSKTGAYAKFLVNAVPIVHTLLEKIEQLQSEASRRDAELLEIMESMLDNDNCSKHWSDGCRICARNESIYEIIKLIKGE